MFRKIKESKVENKFLPNHKKRAVKFLKTQKRKPKSYFNKKNWRLNDN